MDDEAKARGSDINVPAIRQMNPQWDEGFAIQFLSK